MSVRDLLIEYIREVVAIPATYQRKEDIMQMLQADITSRIESGEITDDAGIKDYVDTVAMAANALRMVPYGAFRGPKKAA